MAISSSTDKPRESAQSQAGSVTAASLNRITGSFLAHMAKGQERKFEAVQKLEPEGKPHVAHITMEKLMGPEWARLSDDQKRLNALLGGLTMNMTPEKKFLFSLLLIRNLSTSGRQH